MEIVSSYLPWKNTAEIDGDLRGGNMAVGSGMSVKIRSEFHRNGISGVLNKLRRKLKHLAFYTTCSNWYHCDIKKLVEIGAEKGKFCPEFLVKDKRIIVDWLKQNHDRFPWIYIEKEIESSLRNEHIYLTIFEDSNVVGYLKIGIGQTYIHDFDREVIFPEKIAFIYDTFVLPEYRGKNLAQLIVKLAADHLSGEGYEKIICHIESWNAQSVRFFEKIGFSTIDTIRFTRILRFTFFSRNGLHPFFSMENYLKRVCAR